MPVIRLFSTGQDSNGTPLEAGSDGNWTVDGSPAVMLDGDKLQQDWGSVVGAQWLWKNAQGDATSQDGTPCVFTQSFDLSSCDLSSVQLTLTYSAANYAEVRLNGLFIDSSNSIATAKDVTAQGPTNFIQGVNVLTINVTNGVSPNGLAVRAECFANPQTPTEQVNSAQHQITVQFPVVVPPSTNPYSLSYPIPSNAVIQGSPTVAFDGGSYSTTPVTVVASKTLENRLAVSIAAVDNPLRLESAGRVVAANASVTVTLSTSAM